MKTSKESRRSQNPGDRVLELKLSKKFRENPSWNLISGFFRSDSIFSRGFGFFISWDFYHRDRKFRGIWDFLSRRLIIFILGIRGFLNKEFYPGNQGFFQTWRLWSPGLGIFSDLDIFISGIGNFILVIEAFQILWFLSRE